MAHDLLCAALLLLGCLRPARAARLAIAALGICRASYLDLLLDAASSFSSTAARACLSSQHTARERTRPIPSRARGLFMLLVGHNNRLGLEEIQRKSRVREWTPQNAPRIRAGVTKKDQKAELKKNQTRRCYAEKTSIFFQTTGRHPPGARRETTEVKTRKC